MRSTQQFKYVKLKERSSNNITMCAVIPWAFASSSAFLDASTEIKAAGRKSAGTKFRTYCAAIVIANNKIYFAV